MHSCDLRIQKAEAGGSQIQGQLGYIVRHCFKTNKPSYQQRKSKSQLNIAVLKSTDNTPPL